MRTALVWLMLLAQIAQAEPSVRVDIESLYRKTSVAAELKYLDGIFARRAPGFVAFNPEGGRVDLSAERVVFERLLEPAISVKLETTLVKFEQLGPDRVRCEVREKLVVMLPESGSRKSDTLVLQSSSLDDWVKTRYGWRQVATRVQRQNLKRSAP